MFKKSILWRKVIVTFSIVDRNIETCKNIQEKISRYLFFFHFLTNFRNSGNNFRNNSLDHCISVSLTYFSVYLDCHIFSNRLLASILFVSMIRMKTWIICKKLFENKIEIKNLEKSEKIFDNQKSRSIYFLYLVDRNFQTNMKKRFDKRKRKCTSKIVLC